VSKPKTSNDTTDHGSYGRIFVLSAPSGAGKSTLAQAVIAATPGVVRSVTYTTRPPRPGEVDGCNYHFISHEAFLQRLGAGELLESATIHGYLYGTSRLDVTRLCQQGFDVLLVIDYQGAAALRRQRLEALYIFILPPSLAALQQRIRQRNADDEASMRTRLAVAPMEMAQYRDYDYVIVNDDLKSATQQLQAIILADRCCLSRLNRRYPIFAEMDGWIHERGPST
jgi:guanylate kinase